MIECSAFVEGLKQRGINLFCGVPDSLLSSLCAWVDEHAPAGSHVITANEGNAIALALGWHLSGAGTAAVYLQNSGLGNTINPLTSLADPEVYRVPMLLIIGWRGEPGVKDEPQHIKQGRITLEQLKLLGIPHWILDGGSDLQATLDSVSNELERTGAPVALVVRKDTFSAVESTRSAPALSGMGREEALAAVLSLCDSRDLLVSTTGKTSRELYELRALRGETQRDFLTVGGMGHVSSIALGLAMGRPDRRVICLDGDGAALMHLGAIPVIAGQRPRRLVHVVLNNGAHESVGGQATAAAHVDLCAIARASGYRRACSVQNLDELGEQWRVLASEEGPSLLEVRIRCGSRPDLGRPKSSAESNKLAFMAHVAH